MEGVYVGRKLNTSNQPMLEMPGLPGRASSLVGLALALGAQSVPDWTQAEETLSIGVPVPQPLVLSNTHAAIQRHEDPLGEAFCRAFSNEERRPQGATYTPQPIIDAMLAWAAEHIDPVRIVDPGAGTARFLVTAGRRFPSAELIASEIDPLAALLARGHLAAAGLANRSRVVVGDYRALELPQVDGRTLYLGNPPYVRHHLITPAWKDWLTKTAKQFGHEASQLAGLHVHFFLATAEHAKRGDVGILVTAAEWLDVNYGRLVRDLLLGVLGGQSICVIEPTADPFPGTQTTAVITGFEVGSRPQTIGLRRVATLNELGSLPPERLVRRERMEVADRWTPLTRAPVERRAGFVELGELCRVHRGQVTGANEVWVSSENPFELPEEVLFASVTRARELIATNGVLDDASTLRRVIDLPSDLGQFAPEQMKHINTFLAYARAKGADSGFIARNRKAWWSVGLRKPAPILATYMARRPPVFVRNLADARHINVAHGLYPRAYLGNEELNALATYLSRSISTADGRTYAGGLTKFEPREMERLLVPTPELLRASSVETLLA
jgi:hypothetical protein